MSPQPLAYLYLSQIPQTGLSLGPLGTTLYWLILVGFALAAAYFSLFSVVPFVSRSLRNFGFRVSTALNAQGSSHLVEHNRVPQRSVGQSVTPHPSGRDETSPEAPRGYSSYEGFRSFAHNGALSIEDIVKSLSRHRTAPVTLRDAESTPNVEPIYEKVEPIYERVEPIGIENDTSTRPVSAPTHVRGLVAALLEGDRVAVFTGLRHHLRGGGAPERLMTDAVCLLDDVYRSRIDGTDCDLGIARMTARLNTPALEKLVTSLATAIDASYSTGVTAAKLALTRALTVLGA